jgi:hypothetical protein
VNGGSLNHPKSDADVGRAKGRNVSRADFSAHSKTPFCAYARSSLRHRTPKYSVVITDRDDPYSDSDTSAPAAPVGTM